VLRWHVRPLVPLFLLTLLTGCIMDGGGWRPFPLADAGDSDGGTAIDGPLADTATGPGVPATTAMSLLIMPGPGMTPIVNAIKGAKTSVDLTVYYLSDSTVISALIGARNAGRTVRVILEDQPDSLSNAAAYNQLVTAGVQVRWGQPAFVFTHAKYMVIDGTTLWAMTMNLASSAPSTNREHIVIDSDPDDVAEARAVFEADWNRTNSPAVSRLVVSPVNARARLNQLIDSAQSELLIEWEALSDSDIVTHINMRLKAGVKVMIVIPDSAAGTQTATMVGALGIGGALVRQLGSPDVHTKMILVDRTTGFAGSENATANSLDRNRELGVIWRDATAAQAVVTAFMSDFNKGVPLQ